MRELSLVGTQEEYPKDIIKQKIQSVHSGYRDYVYFIISFRGFSLATCCSLPLINMCDYLRTVKQGLQLVELTDCSCIG